MKHSALLAALFGVIACHSPTAPATGLDVSITGYSADEMSSSFVTVHFDVANTTNAVVYVPRCGDHIPTEVDLWENRRWVKVSGAVCLTFLPMDPIAVEPGETVSGMRAISGSGRFRLRAGFAPAPSAAVDWSAVSEPFNLPQHAPHTNTTH